MTDEAVISSTITSPSESAVTTGEIAAEKLRACCGKIGAEREKLLRPYGHLEVERATRIESLIGQLKEPLDEANLIYETASLNPSAATEDYTKKAISSGTSGRYASLITYCLNT